MDRLDVYALIRGPLPETVPAPMPGSMMTALPLPTDDLSADDLPRLETRRRGAVDKPFRSRSAAPDMKHDHEVHHQSTPGRSCSALSGGHRVVKAVNAKSLLTVATRTE